MRQIFWRNFVEPEVDLLTDTNCYGEIVLNSEDKKSYKKELKKNQSNLIKSK